MFTPKRSSSLRKVAALLSVTAATALVVGSTTGATAMADGDPASVAVAEVVEEPVVEEPVVEEPVVEEPVVEEPVVEEPAVEQPAVEQPAPLGEATATMPQSRIAIVAEATFALLDAPQQQNNGGAIYTTNSEGDVVNGNNYDSKDEVWLSGGPVHNSGDLPNGTYYVQVTAPGGGVLGRSGPIVVTNGKFRYRLSDIVSHDGTPGYLDSTNDGGVYKVWVSTDSTFAHADTKFDNFNVSLAPTTTAPPNTETPTSETPTTTAPPSDETPTSVLPISETPTTTASPNNETPSTQPATATAVEPTTTTAQVAEPGPAPETGSPSGVAAADGALPVTGGAAWAIGVVGAILMAAGVTFNRISRRDKSVTS